MEIPLKVSTLNLYKLTLKKFVKFCEEQIIKFITVDSTCLRKTSVSDYFEIGGKKRMDMLLAK